MRDWLKRWLGFCLLVLLLFTMASPAGTLALSAYGRLGVSNVGRILLAMVLAVLAALLLVPILRDRERRTPAFLLGTLSLGLVYLVCLTRMAPHPVGKIHFAAFGLLAYLSYSAMEEKGSGNSFLKSFLLVSLIGFLDEVYQGFLPNRYYDPRDILVNMTSAFLGLLLTLSLKRARPGSVFRNILHRSNLPYVLLWMPAGVLLLHIHNVPERTELIPGTWHRLGFCQVEEWLRLEPDGTLLWWDEDGNRARGEYRVTGNRLQGLYFKSWGRQAHNKSECGWQAGMDVDVAVRVEAHRLIFVPDPDRFWTRTGTVSTPTDERTRPYP